MTQPAATQAVDFGHLRIQAGDDAEVMREVLHLFVIHTGQMIDELAGTADPAVWKRLTHTLKGSARGIGAFDVADAAAAAEGLSPDPAHLVTLREAYQRARSYIEANPV